MSLTKRVAIRDVCKIHGGKPAPTDDDAYDPLGTPFVRMKDLGRFHLTANLIETEDRLSESWMLENGYRPLSEGCILLPRSGSVALNHRAILGTKAVIVSHLCGLEVIDSSMVDTQFLYRFLCSINFDRITKKTTGLDAINFSDLGEVEILLPPILEQRRIANILNRAESIAKKRSAAVLDAGNLLRSSYFELFGDPVSNSRGLPEKPIADLAKITTGNTPSRQVPSYFGNHIEWIKSDNLNTPSHYLTKATEGLSEAGLRVGRSAPAGSTLITCIAGSPSCIGNAALADRVVSFNQQINALTPKPGVEPEFIYATTLFSKVRIQAASTSGMKGMVSKGALEQVRFILPPKVQREKFVAVFRKVMSLTVRLEGAVRDAGSLYGSLAQRAFQGHL